MASFFFGPDPLQSTFLVPGGNTPATGAQIFIYVAGSVSTKTTVYKDNAGNTAWSNPIVLDSGGNLPSGGVIWIPSGVTIKAVWAPSNDTDPPTSPYRTIDNISGINDTTGSQTEWIPGPTPTFVSATQFTLVGDQTGTFTVGRRGKFTVTAGTVYGRISASAFGVVTTVTMVMDGTTALDSGLSVVSYGLLAASNPSVPFVGGMFPTPLDTQTVTAYTIPSGNDGKVTINNATSAATYTMPVPNTVKTGWGTVIRNAAVTGLSVKQGSTESFFGPGLTTTGTSSFSLPFVGASSSAGLYNVSSVEAITDGANWQLIRGFAVHGEVMFTASSGSFLIPSGVTSVWIDAAAGGASGGGAANAANTAGGGGGGGDSVISQYFTVAPGQTATITIGQGGASTAAGNTNGNDGTSTTISGALTLSLSPGLKGTGAAAGTGNLGGASGGTSAGPGSFGLSLLNTGAAAIGGFGGGNQWASQSFNITNASANGTAGVKYGGGGAGGTSNGGGAASGGAGASGFVRIRW